MGRKILVELEVGEEQQYLDTGVAMTGLTHPGLMGALVLYHNPGCQEVALKQFEAQQEPGIMENLQAAISSMKSTFNI